MDINDIITHIPALLHGLFLTLQLVAAALFIGFVLALGMTLLCLSEKPWLKQPIQAFIFCIRGTPLLVQIFLIYYGSGQFPSLQGTLLWELLKEPFACAVIALGINSSAYSTEILLGAIRAIPYGEIEACDAFGLSWWQKLRCIILPRALRIVLPAYSNEVIILVKASSLASTITLLDLMGTTQQLINQTYSTLEFLSLAGVLYLALNGGFMVLFRTLERHYNRYLYK